MRLLGRVILRLKQGNLTIKPPLISHHHCATKGTEQMGSSIKVSLQTLVTQARRDQADFLATLNDTERAAFGTPDHWSVRDHINHNNFWRERLLAIFQATHIHVPPASINDSEEMNQSIFVTRHILPWETILAESERLYAAIDEGLEAMSENELTDPTRYYFPNAGNLQSRVIHFAYEHPLSHYVQLWRERGDSSQAVRTQQEAITLTEHLFGKEDAYCILVYNLGCLFAVINEPQNALTSLQDAFALIPTDHLKEWKESALEDAELISLRNLPEFQALLQENV